MPHPLLAVFDLNTVLEWINPVGNPDKLKPIGSILAILLTLTRLMYYWIKIAADPTKAKKRGGVIDRLSKLIKRKPWLMPAVHVVSWIALFAFVVAIAWQAQLIATQTAKLSSTVLPGARNDNIASIEARLRALEDKAKQPVPEYRLVWFDSRRGDKLFQVLKTQPARTEVENNEFDSWCVPLDLHGYTVRDKYLVAGHEHFQDVGKGPPNWWTAEPYKLPELRERWLQIMDDERWYVYEVVKTNP